jgi:divalent metal cation (Fe/Co/Zn/Cd) transporter
MGTPSSTRVALYSVFLNLTITAGKGVLAYLSGSTALFAETIRILRYEVCNKKINKYFQVD